MSAVLAGLGGVITLLLSGVLVWTALAAASPDANANLPLPLRPVLFGVAVFFLLLTIWSITTAAGIFRRREWARLSIVIFAVLLVGMGVSAVVGTLVAPVPPNASVSEAAMGRIRLMIIVLYSAMAAVGVWWLFLFNSRRTKDYFSGAALEDRGGRPLSITLIGWFLLLSALVTAFSAIVQVPGMFFGVLLTRWTALAAYSLLTAVNIYLGVGLLQLHQSARIAGIVYFAILAANSIAMFALPGFPARIQAIQDAMRGFVRVDQIPIPFESYWIFGLIGAVIAAVPIWFLVRRRAAFA